MSSSKKENSFFPCIAWVPQGAAVNRPKKVASTQEYIQKLRDATADAHEGDSDFPADDAEQARINEEYGLDDYDDDAETAMNVDNNGDDSDSMASDEDFELEATDNLLIVGKVQEQEGASSAEVHVYNEPNKQFYAHHDFYLTSFPLCMEWFSSTPKETDKACNFLAVGLMEPTIELWNLDVLDSLVPEFELGKGSDKKAKSKASRKKTSTTPPALCHTDAVLDISWNRNSSHILASASADHTVGLWDLNTCLCVTQFRHHKDKVQTLSWHSAEAQTLLSGGYDKSVFLVDCRQAEESRLSWPLAGEVERAVWSSLNPYYFLASTDSGIIHVCDARKASSPVTSVSAHEGSCAGLVSSPHLVVSGGGDGLIKAWRMESTGELQELSSRDWSLGEVTSLKKNPNCDFVYGFSGSQDYKVWDVREDARIRSFLKSQGLQIEEPDTPA